MARQLQRPKYGVSFGDRDEYHPGCMWGIFHVLDYHFWHDAKKMPLPHKKRRRGRHAICCTNPKTISMEHEVGEAKPFLDVEADLLLVDEQVTKASPGKAKTLANTEEKPRGGTYKDWNSGFTSRSQSQQTDSIEHFKSGWINPIILVHNKAADTSASRTRSLSLPNAINNQKQMDMKLNKEFSDDQVKEYVDVLEILNVKKDLFLTILEDPDVGVPKSSHGNQTPKTNTKFSKSGSFPLADSSSRVRYLRPTTLEHKQNDRWSKKMSKPNVRSVPSRPNGRNVRQETQSSSSQCSSEEAHDNQGWSHTVMNHYKEIKQKIKHVLKDRMKKKKNKRSSSTMKEDGVRDSKPYHGPHMTRTTSFVNDPLDRYARLLDHGVSREAKWHHSKSLKVRNEDDNNNIASSRGRPPNFFRRISSLSDIESFYSFLNEVSRDSFSLDVPFRSSSNIEGGSKESINDVLEIEQIAKTESRASFGSVNDPTIGKNEGDNRVATEKDDECSSSAFVFPHNATGPTECLIYEGSNLDADGIYIDESNTLLELQETLTGDNSEVFSGGNTQKNKSDEYANNDNQFEHFEVEKDDIGYFNYVRNVLELSGFLRNNCLEKWHSQTQPINPTLIKDLEVCWEHELLFDLINETLIEMRDSSFAYFPKSRISSLSNGRRVLKDVWSRIGSRLKSGSKVNQSLDDIVGRDFVGDNWMKLELDAEFVELEVDELIFDELLNELICEVNQMKG